MQLHSVQKQYFEDEQQQFFNFLVGIEYRVRI